MSIFYQILNFLGGLLLAYIFLWLMKIAISLLVLVLRKKFKPAVIFYIAGIIVFWIGVEYFVVRFSPILEIPSIGFLLGVGLAFLFVISVYVRELVSTSGKLDWQIYALYLRKWLKTPDDVQNVHTDIALATWNYYERLIGRKTYRQEFEKYDQQISVLMKKFEFSDTEKQNLIKALEFFELNKDAISSVLDNYKHLATLKEIDRMIEGAPS